MSTPGGFVEAPQAHMLRAMQKDTYYSQQIAERVKALALGLFGRRAARMERETRLVANLCYYGLTTLRGMQTLGEEYCDIMQVDGERRGVALPQRVLLTMLQALGPYLERSRSIAVHPRAAWPRRAYAFLFNALLYSAKEVLRILDPLESVHMALFFLFGRYLQMSKRVCGVRYVHLQRPGTQVGYQVLGILLGIQLAGKALARVARQVGRGGGTGAQVDLYSDGVDSRGADKGTGGADEAESLQESKGPRCTLCLETRKFTTATECGHLFCWSCIIEACNVKPECPMCRQRISRQNLVVLEAYRPATEDQQGEREGNDSDSSLETDSKRSE